MSNDAATNDFIRDCVVRAARFRNAGHQLSSDIVLDIARRAIDSPQETAPLHAYASEVETSIRLAFGYDFALADLSHHRQLEAVYLWAWWTETFGTSRSKTVDAAIAALRAGGPGWRERVMQILETEPDRHRAPEFEDA